MERNRGGRPRHPGILTPAERRVLDALREGGTNAEIAARLGIGAETVKTHISTMLAKLGLSDRQQLAAWREDAAPRGRERLEAERAKALSWCRERAVHPEALTRRAIQIPA